MQDSMFDLSDEVAIIVGGAGGLGSAGAKGVAEFGATVVVADRDLAGAEKVTSQIREISRDAMAIQVDITDPEQVETMVDKTLERFGKIDIMTNYVATTARKPALELSLEEWRNIIDTNLTAAFILSKAVVKPMIKVRKGKIVHFASSGGITADANFSAYAASKAGLMHLVRVLAKEWVSYNININGIAPTASDTPFTAKYYAQHPEKKEGVIKAIPAGRLGQPGDLVGALVYLCSSASDFVHGQILIVDGGITL